MNDSLIVVESTADTKQNHEELRTPIKSNDYLRAEGKYG